MSIEDQNKFVALLRKICFGPSKNLQLSREECNLLLQNNLGYFVYYFSYDNLPQNDQKKWEQSWLQADMLDCLQVSYAETIQKELAKQHLSSCLIKGADLAVNFYPSSVLRPRCDIDLLVRRAESEKAYEILLANGWSTREIYQHDFHYPSLFKNGIMCELHFDLPGIKDFDFDADTEIKDASQPFIHSLPAMVHLMLLYSHAMGHNWNNGKQFLLDTGFLLNKHGNINWPEINILSTKYHLASLAPFIEAFDDFFPQQFLPGTRDLSNKFRNNLRTIVLDSYNYQKICCEQTLLATNHFSLTWWFERLKMFSPYAARAWCYSHDKRYKNIFFAYCSMCLGKIKQVFDFYFSKQDKDTIDKVKRLQFVNNYIEKYRK